MKNKDKSGIVSNRKITALWAGLSFFLPAAVISVLLAANAITPFGNATLITEVGSGWFENLCRTYESVISGDGVFYNLDIGFGGSFYSEFASGLCSPFLFAALFFPSGRLAAAYSVITILRAGFAGLFAWTMLDKCVGISKSLSFALACGYALCGFTACAAYYPSIADAAVFFPLVITGIYVYTFQGRPLRLFLCASLFFITCSRLFIGGTVVCFMMYFAFYYRRKNPGAPLYKFAMFSATLLCSAASAAVMIVPLGVSAAYYKDGVFCRVDSVDPLMAVCFGGYASVSDTGSCCICIAGLLIMGIAAFMLNKCISVHERIFVGATAALIIMASALPVIGSIMFGFCAYTDEKVNMGFVLAALAIYCTARNFAEPDGVSLTTAGISAGAFVMICIPSILMRKSEVFAVLAESGLAVLFIAVFISICVTLRYNKGSISLRLCALTAAAITIFGIIHCGAAIDGINSPYCSDLLASDSIQKLRINQSISADEEAAGRSMRFFRYRSVDNASYGANLTRNEAAGLEEFAKRLGIMPNSEFGGGENFTPLTDVIFGTGYVIKSGMVYEVQNAAQSPAYLVNHFDDDIIYEGTAFDVQNRLAADWFGVEDLFTPADFELQESTSSAENERYKWIFGNETTYVNKYAVKLNVGDSLFLLTEKGNYSYAIDGDSRSDWHDGQEGGIYTLCDDAADCGGIEIYISAGETSEGGAQKIPKPTFMVISDELQRTLADRASERGAEYISHRGSSINFMLTTDAPKTAVTSVPYEYGWEITDNGQKIDATEICGGLIGIELGSGKHSIVMKYTPPFFKFSLIFSSAFFLMGMYMTLCTEREISRRRKVRMAFRAAELNRQKTHMNKNSQRE